MTTPDDLDRSFAAAAADPARLEDALRAATAPAWMQARRALGNDADADDAVQESLLRLARTLRRFDGRIAAGAFLGRIVLDACRMQRRAAQRRQRREAAAMPTAADASAADPAAHAEDVRAACAALPAHERSVVELHYFAGLAQRETAAALGVAEPTVAKRLQRARERLRALLAGRGIGLGLAGVAAALEQVAASPPPAALDAAVRAIAQAPPASWPSHHIPTTTADRICDIMRHHPIAAAAIAGGLVLLGGAALPLLIAGDAAQPPPAPPVAAAAGAYFQGRAGETLRWLDPEASFRFALDAAILRRAGLTAKPTSLLADPRAGIAIERCRAWLSRERGLGDTWNWWAYTLTKTAGAAVSIRGRPPIDAAVPGLAPPDPRISLGVAGRRLLAWGTDAADLPMIAALLHAPRHSDQVDAIIGGMRGTIHDSTYEWSHTRPDGQTDGGRGNLGTFFLGSDGRQIVYGIRDWVAEREAAPRVAVDPATGAAPAWCRVDFRRTIAAYDRMMDERQRGLVGTGAVLGPAWRTLRPILDGTLSVADGAWRGRWQMAGCPEISPMVVPILTAHTPSRFAPLARMPLRPLRADCAAGIGDGALAWAAMGCDPAGVVVDNPIVRGFLGIWSGDAAVVVDPGTPFPTLTLTLGLRPGTAAAAVSAAAAGFGFAPVAPPVGASAAWSGMIDGLPLPVTALRSGDRLILTTAGDPSAAAARAPTGPPPAAAIAASIDLPAVARAWLPFAAGLLPQATAGAPTAFDRGCLPPAEVLAEHLPRWTLTWTPTADGAVLEERGIPIACVALGVACASLVGDLDPQGEADMAGAPAEPPAPSAPPSGRDF